MIVKCDKGEIITEKVSEIFRYDKKLQKHYEQYCELKYLKDGNIEFISTTVYPEEGEPFVIYGVYAI